MLIAAAAMGVPILCMAEVASQFPEPGGPYLWVRTAFGRFAGMQIGWFHLLASLAGGAASAVLFVTYMGAVGPWAEKGWIRALVLAVLIAIPTAANYVGIRSGAQLTNLLTVSKLLPLTLIVALGLIRFSHHPEFMAASDITSHPPASWLTALLLLVFSYAGSEDALVPAGEVKDARHTVPFGLLTGVLVCMILYALVQFVTVSVIGINSTERPLAATASGLLGRGGEMLVAISVMLSTYGWLSGVILNLPRLASSLASHGDFPDFLARLHPRFNTPTTAVVLFALIVWLMAATGTFLWAAAVSGGAAILIYIGACSALIRLRQQRPSADALRIPYGRMLGVTGIVMMLGLLTRLSVREALAIAITLLLAALNWWWAKQRALQRQGISQAVAAVGTSN